MIENRIIQAAEIIFIFQAQRKMAKKKKKNRVYVDRELTYTVNLNDLVHQSLIPSPIILI